MKQVVVQFHAQVEEELARWLGGDEGDDEEHRALVRLYVEELVQRLRETAGLPPGAVRVSRGEPPTYRWRYTGEAVVDFQVRDEPGRFPRRGRVRVIVTRIRLVSSG